MSMTSSRPYLIRALYEWILNNDMTPYLVVNAEVEGVDVPHQFITNGEIVLNIDANAAVGMDMTGDWVLFDARFQGKGFAISVPWAAVKAIYAKETGQGMSFSGDEPGGGPDGSPGAPADAGGGKGPPGLRIVK